MSNFKSFATYYDLLYQDKDYSFEAEYISKLLEKYAPKAKNILNMGCGSGAHDFELAKKNYVIDGIDLSENMIARAEKKRMNSPLKNQLTFSTGDIRHFANEKKYDAVISLFHVFSYLTSNEDLLLAAQAANKALDEEGILIFDCWFGPTILTEKPSIKIKRIQEKEIEMTRIAEPSMDFNTNTVRVDYTIFAKENGVAQNPITESHLLRYWFTPELEFILKQAGFKMLDYFAWMTEQKPDTNSWGAVFILKKDHPEKKIK